VQSVVYALGAGVGFTLALVLMAGLREKLELASVPEVVRGTALTLILAGLLSLAFMGFAGLGA
jgi:electron transport complex protein RnfA